jgi:hypothetical protein
LNFSQTRCKKLFGSSWNQLYDFINSLESFPWFENIGKNLEADDNIVRAGSLKDAVAMLPLSNKGDPDVLKKSRLLFNIAKSRGQFIQEAWTTIVMDVPGVNYRLFKKHTKKILKQKASSWICHTALEYLVSDSPDCPFYHRRLIPWYKNGYWPVGIRDTDQKIIVY